MISPRPTRHAATLRAEVERLAARLAAAPPGDVEAARGAAARATLRLDGGRRDTLDRAHQRTGWHRTLAGGALALDEAADEDVGALELRGARRALAADDLVGPLTSGGPDVALRALRTLHARLTDGLLDPALAGVPRRTDQAVQDAATGRVLYFAPPPREVPGRLAELLRWIAEEAPGLPPLAASGALHWALLDLHPFEAATGRLARAAARLWLRGHGLDPHGVSQPEAALWQDRLGYLDEVARSRRRRETSGFVERWGEAVADGLRGALSPRGALPNTAVTPALSRLLDARAGQQVTLGDVRDALGVDVDAAAAELSAALDAGRVQRIPGTRGLRWIA